MKKIIKYIKFIGRRFGRILLFPSAEWKQVATEKPSIKSLLSSYILPLIIFCGILHFLCALLYHTDSVNLLLALGELLKVLLFYAVVYYLAIAIGGFLLYGCISKKKEILTVYTLVTYSMTVYFAVDILLTLLPSMSYLQILNFYVIYLLYIGCKTLDIQNRGSINRAVVILSVTMVALPVILRLVLKLLFPNM